MNPPDDDGCGGIPIYYEMYWGWEDPYATAPMVYPGGQQPRIPSCTARVPFRSTPPTASAPKPTYNVLPQNANFLNKPLHYQTPLPAERYFQLQQQQQRGTSSTSSANVWQSRSQSQAQQRRRRNSTPSVTSSTAQDTWASRSRTPESQNSKIQARKIKQVGPKKTQETKRLTKRDKIAAIYDKGEKFGQLSNGVWYKASEGSKAPVRKSTQYRQRSAAKPKSAYRQAKSRTLGDWVHQPKQKASEETLKALKKLRKKVKQCAKIQKSVDNGIKVEDNQLEKLKQLNEFKQQIAELELRVSTGKAVDKQGFQLVSKSKRRW